MGPLKTLLVKAAHVARTQQKTIGFATTILALAVIGVLTLKPLGGKLPAGFLTCVICGTYGTADFILNVALFVPLGFGLRLCGTPRYRVWVAGLALSTVIETLQNYVISGRDSSLGDILANTAGAVVGVWLADNLGMLLVPAPRRAATLSALVIGAWLTLALVFHYSIEPTPAPLPYWGQVDVDSGGVREASVEGSPVPDGPMDGRLATRVRGALERRRVRLSAQYQWPDNGAVRAVHIIRIVNNHGEEALSLAATGTKIVFSMRTHLDDWKLHPLLASLAWPRRRDDSTVVDVGDSAQQVAIRVRDRRGRIVAVQRGTSVARAWQALVPRGWSLWPRRSLVLTIALVGTFLAPAAYWQHRAAGATRATLQSIAALTAAFVLIPLAAGAGLAPIGDWVIGGAWSAVGQLIAHVAFRSEP
jgi:hypothetical protein